MPFHEMLIFKTWNLSFFILRTWPVLMHEAQLGQLNFTLHTYAYLCESLNISGIWSSYMPLGIDLQCKHGVYV